MANFDSSDASIHWISTKCKYPLEEEEKKEEEKEEEEKEEEKEEVKTQDMKDLEIAPTLHFTDITAIIAQLANV